MKERQEAEYSERQKIPSRAQTAEKEPRGSGVSPPWVPSFGAQGVTAQVWSRELCLAVSDQERSGAAHPTMQHPQGQTTEELTRTTPSWFWCSPRLHIHCSPVSAHPALFWPGAHAPGANTVLHSIAPCWLDQTSRHSCVCCCDWAGVPHSLNSSSSS